MRGAINILKWLQQQRVNFSAATLENAASNGHLTTCQWLLAQGCSWDQDACSSSVEMATWMYLHDSGCDWHPDSLLLAALDVNPKENFAGMLQYILD
jgi:hypothetical protein